MIVDPALVECDVMKNRAFKHHCNRRVSGDDKAIVKNFQLDANDNQILEIFILIGN